MRLYNWLQRVWYANAPSGVLLVPLAWLYGALVWVRGELYRRGWLASIAIGKPVIVVGNLTAGGTGKTPLVLWLAAQLTERGIRPGIVTRGYGGRSRAAQRVSVVAGAEEIGDEAVLLARRSHCPVAVGANRVAAAQLLEPAVDVVIADDGLQHLRLRRDIEIVVIDGERRFGNGRLLPAGPLREPIGRLADVDALVVTGESEGVGGFKMSLAPGDAIALEGGEHRALSDFTGSVHALAAIGNPQRFFTMLRAHGLQVIPHPLPDHQPLTARDIDFDDSLPVLMTEKDAVKCTNFADKRHWYVPVAAAFGEADGRQLLALTMRGIRRDDP